MADWRQFFAQYGPEFAALWTLNFLNLISPGAETALMVRNSSRFSRKAGVMTGLGIVASTCIHKTYTLLGFGAVIARSPRVFMAVKAVASLYLCYLGVQALRASFQPAAQGADLPEAGRTLSPWQAFRMGFLVDILHPAASLFFMTIVAVTVSPTTPLNVQGLYGALLVMTSFGWYTFLAFFFSNAVLRQYLQRFHIWTDRITGFALILLGVRLAFLSIR